MNEFDFVVVLLHINKYWLFQGKTGDWTRHLKANSHKNNEKQPDKHSKEIWEFYKRSKHLFKFINKK